MIRTLSVVCLFFYSIASFALTFSKRYEGLVGSYPVSFTLYARDGKLSGTYYYDNSTEPISIRGFISGRSIEMQGFDLKGNAIERFVGQFNKFDINGIWIGEGSRERQTFNLKETALITPQTSKKDWLPYVFIVSCLLGATFLLFTLRKAMKRMTLITGAYAVRIADLFRRKDEDYEFEKYMTDKLSADTYKLIEWHTAHTDLNDQSRPDLEFERRHTDHQDKIFSIECEYKPRMNNTIEIKKRGLRLQPAGKPVFFAIGLGGKPSHPEILYIVPADKVQDEKIDLSEIAEFRITGNRLNYDPEQKTLK
jgi:hypothetical protein